jgi:hypothetical protein
MQTPIGPEVSIYELVPGEEYCAFSNGLGSQFRGIFTEYWTNIAGYQMLRFHSAIYKDIYGYTSSFGTSDRCPHGLYWRVFETREQSYKYYKTSRFTSKQKKELVTRYVLRERRQYERGLTGSTPNDLWFPRDLVREISLKYLTDKRIGFKSRR